MKYQFEVNAEFWKKVKMKALEQGKSVKDVIISLLKSWLGEEK